MNNSQLNSNPSTSLRIKSEFRNSREYRNVENINSKRYDLEERSLQFAKRINVFVKKLAKNISNIEISRQLVRAAGSVGANYIEANESLGKRDFIMYIKISRKEAKEAHYWLRLTEPTSSEENERNALVKEADELMKIFAAIYRKTTQ